MEIKEYLEIIKKDKTLFFAIVFLIVVFSLGAFYFRKPFFQVSQTLNITRSGSQNTDQYKYDDYYRLQADEKFVETVVQWLKDPRIVASILENAGIDSKNKNINQLKKELKSEKLSSQIIAISFSAPDEKTAQSISGAIVRIISENTKNLNRDQREENWFEVVPFQPVIKRYQASHGIILIFSLAGGIFLAFWTVMLRHYLK